MKVPPEERAFLADQRTQRNMIIGIIDKAKTVQIQNRTKRKLLEQEGLMKRIRVEEDGEGKIGAGYDFLEDDENSIESGMDFFTTLPSCSQDIVTTEPQNRHALISLAQTCDRYGVSDRAGAAIASAVLQDYGLTSESNRTNVIDRSKIKRERKRNQSHLQNMNTKTVFHGLYFDGRNDKTMVIQTDVSTRMKIVTEEHISLIGEPNATYVGHFAASSGKAKDIAEGGPGSGKGTQCERIVNGFGYTHFSSGDLLRAEVASGSERGLELKATMERGDLVPLSTILNLIKDNIYSHADSKGFLIDGYPRDVAQGIEFEKTVGPCSMVLWLDVSQDTMVKRLLKRGETSGRVDDNEETIRKRLKTFVDATEPVIKYYQEQNKVFRVDSERDVEAVFEDVRKMFH